MSASNGMRIEVAASVIARDFIIKFFERFGRVVVSDRHTSSTVTAAFIDALAGATALTIQGRHGSKDDVVEQIVKTLRENIERDLKHLKVR